MSFAFWLCCKLFFQKQVTIWSLFCLTRDFLIVHHVHIQEHWLVFLSLPFAYVASPQRSEGLSKERIACQCQWQCKYLQLPNISLWRCFDVASWQVVSEVSARVEDVSLRKHLILLAKTTWYSKIDVTVSSGREGFFYLSSNSGKHSNRDWTVWLF